MDPAGRRVLVTGASRGLGLALAEAFSGAGARLVLVARDADALAAAALRLGAGAHVADLTDPADLGGLVERVEWADGPVDVLVNNAGVERTRLLVEQDFGALEQAVRLNVLAPMELTRQVLPGMLARGRGHVVNVSSLAGVFAIPGMAVYGPTKAALSHLTAQLRAELRGTPVRTTLVQAGPFESPMLERIRRTEATWRAYRRVYRSGFLVDITAHDLAAAVVDAVRRERRHVRLPRRAAAGPLLVEAPRRVMELLQTGVRVR